MSTVYFSDVKDVSFDVLTQKTLNCVLKILTLYLTRRQNADLRFINAIYLRLINFETFSRCCLVRRGPSYLHTFESNASLIMRVTCYLNLKSKVLFLLLFSKRREVS